MINVMIVDDDTINRTAIATMIDWGSLECEIVYEASEGQTALEYIRKHSVQLVITDMKMPIMDGLELIKCIHEEGIRCQIIVVSSYNEFDMVREAFKLGIEDYYLKSELNEAYFYKFIQRVKEKITIEDKETVVNDSIEDTFRDDVLGINSVPKGEYHDFHILVLQLEDFDDLRRRFQNIKSDLLFPIYEILKQIPKIHKDGTIVNYSESKIVICFQREANLSVIKSISERIILVVRNYLNVNVSIGVSNIGVDRNDLQRCIHESLQNTVLRYIYGGRQVYTMEVAEQFQLGELLKQGDQFAPVLKGLKEYDEYKVSKAQSDLLYGRHYEKIEEVKNTVLQMILFESLFFEDMGDSVWNAFSEHVNYVKKLERFKTSAEVMMWCTNYNRWILEYLKSRYHDEGQSNFIQTVKSYLEGNYSNKNLSLGEVAEVSGLNEQYFCSKFRKDVGVSFVDYLTCLRVEKAKELIINTNLKMYEVCDAVGYNSVEHFSRVFRKKVGKTPREYKELNISQ